MKRIAALAVAVLLTVSLLGGCSSKGDDDTTTTTAPSVTTTENVTTTTRHGVLDASDVIVRDGPGFEHSGIGGISYGEDIVIIDREGDWFKIQFGDGVGYISAQYVDTDDAPNASEMAASLPTTTTTVSSATAADGSTQPTVGESLDGIPNTVVEDAFDD